MPKTWAIIVLLWLDFLSAGVAIGHFDDLAGDDDGIDGETN